MHHPIHTCASYCMHTVGSAGVWTKLVKGVNKAPPEGALLAGEVGCEG